MSADEKRKVILDIYHKSKAVYTEKEIITLAAKAGVNANTYVVSPHIILVYVVAISLFLFVFYNNKTELSISIRVLWTTD